MNADYEEEYGLETPGTSTINLDFIDGLEDLQRKDKITLKWNTPRDDVACNFFSAKHLVLDGSTTFSNLTILLRQSSFEKLTVTHFNQDLIKSVLIGLGRHQHCRTLALNGIRQKHHHTTGMLGSTLEYVFREFLIENLTVVTFCSDINCSHWMDFLTNCFRSNMLDRNLQLSNLSKDAAVALYSGLGSCRHISSLSLTHCELMPIRATLLGNSLNEMADGLEKLELNCVEYTRLEYLLQHLHLSRLGTLKELKVHHGDGILDSGCMYMLERKIPPNLERLTLQLDHSTPDLQLNGWISSMNLRYLAIAEFGASPGSNFMAKFANHIQSNSTLIGIKIRNTNLDTRIVSQIQMNRRRRLLGSILAAASDNGFPLILQEMNRRKWFDACYFICRERLLIRR